MKQYESIGSMIKWFIKCRGKSIKQTAIDMGINYTTFSEQLNRSNISVETLFKLAAYLDIDLNWMMVVLGYHGPVNAFEKELIPRMSHDFRIVEQKEVLKVLDQIILDNPVSTPDARRELLKAFKKNTFYLLDVLVPEEQNIYMTMERDKFKFHVDVPFNIKGGPTTMLKRRSVSILYDETKALDLIIEERKDGR